MLIYGHIRPRFLGRLHALLSPLPHFLVLVSCYTDAVTLAMNFTQHSFVLDTGCNNWLLTVFLSFRIYSQKRPPFVGERRTAWACNLITVLERFFSSDSQSLHHLHKSVIHW